MLFEDICVLVVSSIFFFFNDTATTEIYTLSLHDALPIFGRTVIGPFAIIPLLYTLAMGAEDRKSTRLNSSHLVSSYAVFCLKKKNEQVRCRQTEREIENTRNEIRRRHCN